MAFPVVLKSGCLVGDFNIFKDFHSSGQVKDGEGPT